MSTKFFNNRYIELNKCNYRPIFSVFCGDPYKAKGVPELEESNFQLVHHNKGTEAVSKAVVVQKVG